MTSLASAVSGSNAKLLSVRRGFTYIELLVVIGVIAILAALTVVGVREAQIAGQNGRMQADMHAIAAALEAYATDFRGVYPMTRDPGTSVAQGGDQGRHILAKALIGPGPAMPSAPGPDAVWLADGVEGPGFRAVPGGKPWPPYLQPEKFQVKLLSDWVRQKLAESPTDPVALALQGAPDNWEIFDQWGNPIVYLPQRYRSAPNAFPVKAPQDGMYDSNDTIGYWDSSQVLSGGPFSGFIQGVSRTISDGKFTGPYILISAGRDGKFLTNIAQYNDSDDLYNFDH